MRSLWPQFDIDGVHNMWIVKPGDKSKGVGKCTTSHGHVLSGPGSHTTRVHTRETKGIGVSTVYIIIRLSRCVTTGVAWMDGRQAQAASGKLRAGIDGSGGGGGVAYEARGYKQAG